MLCNLPVAVPPETEVILKLTSLSISPSVMVAHTSLKASFSLGVAYSLAVKAIVIPVYKEMIMIGIIFIILVDLRLRSPIVTLVGMVLDRLMGTSLLDIRMLNVSTDSTILSVGIEMFVVVHLLTSPTVNKMSSSSGMKSRPTYYTTYKTLIMADKM